MEDSSIATTVRNTESVYVGPFVQAHHVAFSRLGAAAVERSLARQRHPSTVAAQRTGQLWRTR